MNGERTARVASARRRLLDFRLLQCTRMWRITKGPTAVTTVAYLKTIRGARSYAM
jgi:hypothetical protein